MANISSSTARVGYEIFRSSGCEASKAEINAALKKLGHPPISDRMHRHYRNLCAEGFNRYLSINRFDVARSSQPYEHLSASSRYKYVPSGSGARVTFPRGRRLVEGFGRVERAGETGLVLVFEDADTVKALSGRSRPRLGESVRVDVLDPARQFDARVVDHSEDSGRVVTEVEFERLQSIADITGRTPFPLTRSEFRLVSMPEAEATVDLIGRQLFYLFEVVESARSVVNEAAQLVGDDRYAPVARVKRLRMSSPVDAALGVPDPVSAVMAMAFSLVTLGIQVQRFKRRRLENASLEIENEAKAANAKYEKALAELRTNVVERLATEFSAPAPDPEKLSSLTDLATSIQNLSEQDLDEVRMLNPPSKTG